MVGRSWSFSSQFFVSFLLLLLAGAAVQLVASTSSQDGHHHRKPTKLFVFGDSYADTGNIPRSVGSSSWKEPYGITFPGKPSGRFSDGRVLTDFVAKFLKLKSPIPYTVRKYAGWKVKYGMNFAFGGTGVFDTLAVGLPNMTTQIDFFQNLITSCNSKPGIYTPRQLAQSVALVSIAGNDYTAYLQGGGSIAGMQNFTNGLVSQLIVNLKRIRKLGVKKVLVSAIEPVGCLPTSTKTNSFQYCNSTLNTLGEYHNMLLQKAVTKLNNEANHKGSPFIVLDIYSVFLSIIQDHSKNSRFENPLTPCCIGVDDNSNCGTLDTNGKKMYTLCQDRTKHFFWDAVHPSQAGWETVYSMITHTLQQLYF